ncbi:MAG: signal peptidase II [Lachnospiraceae bacterium]|nr:signal peptidase II [Lachnospiraceae bacterium]
MDKRYTTTFNTYKKPNNVLFFILDIIFTSALVYFDQYTKSLAHIHLKGQPPMSIIKDFLVLQYLENRGAAFGMFQNKKVFFLIIGAAFVVFVIYYLLRLPASKKYHVLRFFLCLMCAGAIGNMIDRFRLEYVIDFIYVVYINFPIFNVADIYVTVSAFALLVLFLFVYSEEDLNLKKARNPYIHSAFREKEEET